MNKYKRKSKKKTLAMGIGILSSAAVVSTGFAAWVIAGGDSVTGTGNISAETVEEAEHTIKLANNGSFGTIRFGAPQELPKTDYNWLQNNASVNSDKENLVVSTTFTVENVTSSLEESEDSIKTILDEKNCAFEETTTDENAKYSKASGHNVVSSMPTIQWQKTVDKTVPGIYLNYKGMSTNPSTTANFDLTIVFGWGSAFTPSGSEKPVNPYQYYNSQIKSDALKADAKEKLEYVASINATFKITLATL